MNWKAYKKPIAATTVALVAGILVGCFSTPSKKVVQPLMMPIKQNLGRNITVVSLCLMVRIFKAVV